MPIHSADVTAVPGDTTTQNTSDSQPPLGTSCGNVDTDPRPPTPAETLTAGTTHVEPASMFTPKIPEMSTQNEPGSLSKDKPTPANSGAAQVEVLAVSIPKPTISKALMEPSTANTPR